MANRQELQTEVARHARFTFSRASGKGGQNVNKLNTKVLAVLDLEALPCLSPAERGRARAKLQARLTQSGGLYLQVQEERSQARNVSLAVERLTDLILAALRVKKKRRPTKVPAGAHAKRIESKKRQTAKKARRRVSRDGE